jgi:hypothetical protein
VEGGDIRAYVNGIFVGSGAAGTASLASGQNPLVIGCGSDLSTNPLQGTVSAVQLSGPVPGSNMDPQLYMGY